MLDKKREFTEQINLTPMENNSSNYQQFERELISRILDYSRDAVSLRSFGKKIVTIYTAHPSLHQKTLCFWQNELSNNQLNIIAPAHLDSDLKRDLESPLLFIALIGNF